MLSLYHSLTRLGAPAMRLALATRLRRGKEDHARISERMGEPGRERPEGPLLWFHAASVGEAQSTLILVNALLDSRDDLHILVTTGTITSARLMADRLPRRAIHQFYPLDHPDWVARFLAHWNPDAVIWMESELWPNMLSAIREARIPAVLMNARMSPRSFRRWSRLRGMARTLLSSFELFIAQTEQDAEAFRHLGAVNVRVRDNLKYSSTPLPHDPYDLVQLKAAVQGRSFWLYASTHDGEEQLAAQVHAGLRDKIPGLLTIIVPRHPERRTAISANLAQTGLKVLFRGKDKSLPAAGDDIYIADTLGELGLFYRLAPVACIGRTFSRDGGGGHNPIEAAQLDCAVIHGPAVQNLAHIFAEMDDSGAARCAQTPDELANIIAGLLTDTAQCDSLRRAGRTFADSKSRVLNDILGDLNPVLVDSGIIRDGIKCA